MFSGVTFSNLWSVTNSVNNRQGWITSPRERTIHTEIFFVLVGAVTISIYSHSPHIAFIKTEMTIMVVRDNTAVTPALGCGITIVIVVFSRNNLTINTTQCSL